MRPARRRVPTPARPPRPWLPWAWQIAHAVEQGLEAAGELAVLRPDAAAGDIAQLVAELVHQAEAGDAQPGVEAEDAGGDRTAGGSGQIFTAVPLTHTISMPLSAPSTS